MSNAIVAHYLNRFGEDWLLHIPDDVKIEIFHELARMEEAESTCRDQWGNWEYSFQRSHRAGLLYKPWLDLKVFQVAQNAGLQSTAIWPNSKKWAICLTHDVDFVSKYDRGLSSWRGPSRELHGGTYLRILYRSARAAIHTLKSPFRSNEDPYWSFEKWIDLENSFGFKSTFLFSPDYISQAHPWDTCFQYSDLVKFRGTLMTASSMMKNIADEGWDVGIHGSIHSARSAKLLEMQKNQVERAIDRQVTSSRQHFLQYDPIITPLVHRDAGILIDSTLGFNRNIGFRSGSCFPHLSWDYLNKNVLNVLQVPLNIMDTGLFATSGLEYNVDQSVIHAIELMDRVQSVGGVLTLNWHPNFICEPKMWDSYRLILQEASMRGAWGCSMSDLLSHYT